MLDAGSLSERYGLKAHCTLSTFHYSQKEDPEFLSPNRTVEAPSGLEPLHRGFADLSLSHLGTAPCFRHDGIVFYGLHSRKGLNLQFSIN
jgi:hypothetical protein